LGALVIGLLPLVGLGLVLRWYSLYPVHLGPTIRYLPGATGVLRIILWIAGLEVFGRAAGLGSEWKIEGADLDRKTVEGER
jgi:hypothetical protein